MSAYHKDQHCATNNRWQNAQKQAQTTEKYLTCYAPSTYTLSAMEKFGNSTTVKALMHKSKNNSSQPKCMKNRRKITQKSSQIKTNNALQTLSSIYHSTSNNNFNVKLVKRGQLKLSAYEPMKNEKKFVKKKATKKPKALQKQNILFEINKQSEKLKRQAKLHQKLNVLLRKKQQRKSKNGKAIEKNDQIESQQKQEFIQNYNTEKQIKLFKEASKSVNLEKSNPSVKQTVTFSKVKGGSNILKTDLNQIVTINANENQSEKRVRKHIQQSIRQQIYKLKIEAKNLKKDQEKIKRSKLYTRYMQAYQEVNTYEAELAHLNKQITSTKSQIAKALRIKKETRQRKNDQRMLEGEIQSNIQNQNHQLVMLINQIDQDNVRVTMKKNRLLQKKRKITQQLQQMQKHLNRLNPTNCQTSQKSQNQRYSNFGTQTYQKRCFQENNNFLTSEKDSNPNTDNSHLQKNQLYVLKEQQQQENQSNIGSPVKKKYPKLQKDRSSMPFKSQASSNDRRLKGSGYEDDDFVGRETDIQVIDLQKMKSVQKVENKDNQYLICDNQINEDQKYGQSSGYASNNSIESFENQEQNSEMDKYSYFSQFQQHENTTNLEQCPKKRHEDNTSQNIYHTSKGSRK